MAAMTLGHFLRGEGHAKLASMGMMLGGILNMLLDPVFIYGFGMGVTGAAVFSWKTALVIVLCFVVCFLGFAPWILGAFIREPQTSLLGAGFLRIACLAVPLTAVNALIIYTLQATGKGVRATILTLCRQGLLNVPLLILMNLVFGLYGMIWIQLVIESIMLPATLGMYGATWRKLTKEKQVTGG